MHKVGICSTSGLLRSAIKTILRDQDIAEFESISEARKSAFIYRTLVLIAHESDLLDDSVKDVKFDDDRLRVIAIAPRFNHGNLVALVNRGVRGYQEESVSSSVLRSAIQTVALGEIALPSVLARHLAGIPRDLGLVPLSAKEMVVIRCLANGYGNKEISRSVGIAEATTKVHVKAIMRKLGVSNRTQAAVWAVRNGFDQPKLLS